ncbi:hypothetical protein [Niallia nealsonii]|uniref:Uncharacterized protein n=1 Tax=Niallia nealsonii TaxID=115979 RepID=A0A2N0YZQ7_9BACI|nr:hypothetical protein [Niallia nealsonii]PKG22743.1 hypothetical protein CWS01_15640 [Niallia nealsonii]
MTETLKNLTWDLTNEIASVGTKVETLKDVQVLMAHLREDMDGAVYRNEEAAYYKENHRMVRVLSELLYYTVNDLNRIYDNADKIGERIHRLSRKNEEN